MPDSTATLPASLLEFIEAAVRRWIPSMTAHQDQEHDQEASPYRHCRRPCCCRCHQRGRAIPRVRGANHEHETIVMLQICVRSASSALLLYNTMVTHLEFFFPPQQLYL
ncbi:hypothetical protein PVAP13_6KG356230 [Panicum virgatum]|uniref:Uncharacterized protein n=1 Tax=Panicum virgatum TaxID=38727 RepID=A0A8T0RGA9_PANVG|nr:hypothetical protein PVAP13_6KG356230 [Panicum virgatum]